MSTPDARRTGARDQAPRLTRRYLGGR